MVESNGQALLIGVTSYASAIYFFDLTASASNKTDLKKTLGQKQGRFSRGPSEGVGVGRRPFFFSRWGVWGHQRICSSLDPWRIKELNFPSPEN